MISDEAIAEVRALEEARRAERVAEWKRATTRDELDAILREHINYRDHDHRRAAEAVIDKGWRPPPRRIDTAEELDALPGRAIVVGNRGALGAAWQLTSHSLTPRPRANWGGAYLADDRLTSEQLLEREGSVTVLWEPEEASR